MKTIILEGILDMEEDDDGNALIGELSQPDQAIFVKLHTYDESRKKTQHKELAALDGKKIRITIEVIK
jgi:hypothetical protein